MNNEHNLHKLREALEKIVSMLPAMHEGSCFYPMHDGEGNYIGEQNVDPITVIAEIASIASLALHECQPTRDPASAVIGDAPVGDTRNPYVKAIEDIRPPSWAAGIDKMPLANNGKAVDCAGFTKLPPVEGSTACLTCGCGSHDTLSMEAVLAVGFGDCTVTKDGVVVYSENQCASTDEFWSGQDAENKAKKDPNHDWRITFMAPLYDSVYQRHGDGHWVLVEKGKGFA